MDATPRNARRPAIALFALCCVLAAGLVGAAYSNHFDNGFHFDDVHVIVNNLSIRGLHDVSRFFTDPQTFTARPQNAVYRPLLTLSFALDYRLGGGLEPRQFHLTQFVLLLVLGALLVALYGGLYATDTPDPWNRWAALAAATLFCVHTANTETVNYLSSRSSLVATLGVVASFVMYRAWPGGRRWLVYLLPMLLAGLAKPLAVMFAPLLALHLLVFGNGSAGDRSRPGRRGIRLLWAVLPAFVAAGALYALLRWMEPETLQYADVDRWTYARSQPFVWLHYFRLFIVPRGLTADTDWSFLSRWTDWRLVAGGAFVVVWVVAAIVAARMRRGRPLAFGMGWFAIALLPTSSVIPLSEVYNEHRIFFPYVGLAAGTGWVALRALRALRHRRRPVLVGTVLTLAVLGAHAVGTHRRNRVWHDDVSLWKDVTLKSPRNARGLMNYGLTRMRRGELEEARDYFERAARLAPNYSVLQVNLGIVKSHLDGAEEAEEHFLRALRLSPGYAQGHFYYARWLKDHGRAPEAMAHLETAVRLSPGDVDANRMLLDLHAARGDGTELQRQVRRVLALAPGDPAATAYGEGRVPFEVTDQTAEAYAELGLQRIHDGKWLEAAALYRHALQLDDSAASSWNNLGWALANAGFYELALPCFDRAMRLDPDLELAPNNRRWTVERYSAAEGRSNP